MNKDKLFARIMEYSWLTIFLSTIFTSIHTFHYYGITKDCLIFSVMALLSLGMFLYRRSRRIKATKQ